MPGDSHKIKNTDHKNQQYQNDKKEVIFRNFSLKQGECIKGMSPDSSFMVYVIKGHLRVTSICTDKQQDAKEGEMFLIPRGRTFHFYAYENISVLVCSISVTIAFCEKHPIGELHKYLKHIPENLKKNEFGLLPIHPYLFDEVLVTHKVIDKQLDYEDFQELKREVFLLYIRYLYTNEEKAFFFQPLLNEDMRFLSKVLKIYHPDITVQEFMENSGMSPSTFNRKFKKAFNMSLGRWLLKKKGDSIKEDLIISELSVREIAEKHCFTPNHLTKFCKKLFNRSPSEIRDDYQDIDYIGQQNFS